MFANILPTTYFENKNVVHLFKGGLGHSFRIRDFKSNVYFP